MEFPASFLSGLSTIILLDLVLAGDNAIVIALAARKLPPPLQKKAVFWGSFGAVAVRIALTAVVVWLLELPGLMLAGGLLLLPIAWKLLKQDEASHDVAAADGFWAALRTIVVADALMGLDNVLAIAGASRGDLLLVVLGLAVSVPLVVWGSTLILKLIERFPVIVYLGAGAIAWTAARMIAHDHLWSGWFATHAWVKYLLDATLVVGVCGGGWLRRRRCRPAAT
ncbi:MULTISPECIES: TerC family protein [unclassified Rhodanobacter]|uniref:TerC family protein n=1 Tax=Rhodanobacter humi TaxID=1888173 RepID=A0ABV4AWI4_9GAMM